MDKTSIGLDKNIALALCYVLGWVSGLVFLFIEKEDKEVRFQAMQSIVVFGSLHAAQLVLSISLIGIPLIQLLVLGGAILWILLIYKGYQGENYRLPFAGDLAEKWLSRVKV